MKMRNWLCASLGALVLAGCSQVGTAGNSAKSFHVQLSVPAPTGTSGSRGVAADGSVTHVCIAVTNASGTSVGTGTLTTISGSYYQGNITVTENGVLNFSAVARDSSEAALYKGSAVATIGDTLGHVSMGLTPCKGLVGEWLFSGDAKDGSGDSNDGTLSASGVSACEDRFGNASSAYYFDGSGSITIPDASSLDFGTGDFSISLWMKSTDTSKWEAGLIQKFNIDNNVGYSLVINPAGFAGVFDAGLCGHDVQSDFSTNYCDDTWHNIVFVRNGGSVLLYIDGSECGSASVLSSYNADSTQPLLLGYFNYSNFKGALDDIRMYNVALNANQIDTLHHEGGFGE